MSTLAERYWQELRPSAAAHRPEGDELASDGTTGRRRRRAPQPQPRRQRTRRAR